MRLCMPVIPAMCIDTRIQACNSGYIDAPVHAYNIGYVDGETELQRDG
jgi:hypothetical protein